MSLGRVSLSDLSDQQLSHMSNYSVYFLRQNPGLDVNCSVYSLTQGSIRYQEFASGQWLRNISSFLPAFYVTNCSIPELWAQIDQQKVSPGDIEMWLAEYESNPYNTADNGDSFVALLFTLVGLCVSSWMLLLLFLLLPKHKQKPVLTQVAILVYLVFLTVVLHKVAAISRDEYYADSLDMVRIISVTYCERFAAVFLVLNVLTQLAFLQLMLKMTRRPWRLANAAWISLVIAACVVAGGFRIPLMRNTSMYVTVPTSAAGTLFMSFRVVFVVWFAFCLAHYTVYGTATPPTQVAYSRKLLPLAILTWIFVGAFIVTSLLLVTLWRDDWLTISWMSFVPALLGKLILTASWEWFYSIHHLELRLEIVDMLGRRITLQDVMDFDDDDRVQRTAPGGHFGSFRGFFRHFSGRKDGNRAKKAFLPAQNASSAAPVVVDCTADEPHAYETLTFGPGLRNNARGERDVRDDDSSEYEVHYIDTESWESVEAVPRGVTNEEEAEVEEVEEEVSGDSSGDLPGETDDTLGHPMDHPMDYTMGHSGHPMGHTLLGHRQHEGTSNQQKDAIDNDSDELPPFRPHPGFNRDDYWDEK